MSARYNGINAATHVENVGVSLGSAATAYLSYLKASGMKRKIQLGKLPVSLVGSVAATDNPRPVPPPGMAVVPCGLELDPSVDAPELYAVLAYFTADPPGVPPLALSGERMAAALAARYGSAFVGMQRGSQLEMPARTQDPDPDKRLACPVAKLAGIAPGSPILALGFPSVDRRLADPHKSHDEVVPREVTVACPPGTSGVIKRAQECRLTADDAAIRTEQATFKTNAYVNDARRLDRPWTCAPLATDPATGAEIAAFCRDNSLNLTKPPDTSGNQTIVNIQADLLTNTSGHYYTFACDTNGTGSCTAVPYTPPAGADVKVRCDKDTPDPRFVVNPYTDPLQLNGQGALQRNPALANQACGRGWTGDLTARYMVRRCNLFKTVAGTDQPLGLRQTIYHITYAAAQCDTDVSY